MSLILVFTDSNDSMHNADNNLFISEKIFLINNYMMMMMKHLHFKVSFHINWVFGGNFSWLL